MNYINIADGVKGLFIENHRFSTTHISVNLYVPLKSERVAVNALLPYVLSSCCKDYPDFSALNLKLSELYGAEVGGIADKIGDTQVLKFFSFSVEDELIPDAVKLTEEACSLLFSMIFEPSVKNDSFLEADVERERRLTLEKIAGIINDKRTYAVSKILAEMYKGEAFGELKTGSYEAVSKITGKDLFAAWQDVIKTAQIRIQVVGKKLPADLFEGLAKKLSGFNRKPTPLSPSVPKAPNKEVCRIEENMDVSQGKLVMGFCTDLVGNDKDTAFLAVFSDLFGGGPYSKLFKNVREKYSLCYYCAARPNRTKGYLLVDSGVEPNNAERAEKEILNQLEDIKKGDISPEDLAASIRSIKDSLICLNDSQASLDAWYSMRLGDTPISPEEYISSIEAVTIEDVIKAAKMYTLDTVYKIMPKKGEN
ncbi:MAG: insulinase family protein [Ruminococcaceae bacterium]|nr:insulinase family protein [Oscillospiraceae bacterium]